MRSEDLTAVKMAMAVFWVVTSFEPVVESLKMETVCSSETLVPT
jgi:hypothetical protein